MLRPLINNITRSASKIDIGSNQDDGRQPYESSGDSKTGFLVGFGRLKATLATSPTVWLWATARHETPHFTEPIVKGSLLELWCKGSSLQATCVYDDELSDISFLTTSTIPVPVPRVPDFNMDTRAAQSVWLAGFPEIVPSTQPVVSKCIVASETVECQRGDNHRWKRNRFFLLDTQSDFGFSGGPCFDESGRIKGMLCASFDTQFSWVLKAEFIHDALMDIVVLETAWRARFLH